MDQILNALAGGNISVAAIPISQLLLALLLSCAIGQIIGWIYMGTHVSPSYSKSFTASLVTLPVIVALMMILMAGSTAIAFGLLAVFAVVRFRNVLKDTRDTTFVLWSIVEGMGVGTMHFFESIVGMVVISGLLLYLWISDFGGRHQFDALLSLDLADSGSSVDERMSVLLDRHAARWRRTGDQHLTQTGTSVAYQLLLRDPKRSQELRQDLLEREDVTQISLYITDDQAES